MVGMSLRSRAAAAIESIHDEITDFITVLDGGGTFREDRWDRPGGGGGVTRVLTDGVTFEKGGVNRSAVEGEMTPEMAARFGGKAAGAEPIHFSATGVSVVVHPRSPMVPTVHLNIRFLELTTRAGRPVDAWFGGGTDLTPTYPYPDDAEHFHRVLRDTCNRHDRRLYPRYKAWCDRYFVNAHRAGEARGVGGIFFDNVRPGGEEGLDADRLLAFWQNVGRVLPAAYGPIVDRRRDEPFGGRERRLQLLRRGRYVEFNLVHDRGTVFGLQTDARIESVLMSLPPLAAWEYAPVFEAESFEAQLMEMLKPRDWV